MKIGISKIEMNSIPIYKLKKQKVKKYFFNLMIHVLFWQEFFSWKEKETTAEQQLHSPLYRFYFSFRKFTDTMAILFIILQIIILICYHAEQLLAVTSTEIEPRPLGVCNPLTTRKFS